MGVQEFLRANGVVDRTPLVKVFSDILGTTKYEDEIMDFLDGKEVGLRGMDNKMTLREVDRFFFIVPLLNTLFNYKIDFNANLKALQGLKWSLEYASYRGYVDKYFLDKYLIGWGIYEDYVNLRSQRPRTATDSFLRLLD
jgi:hypothetical protein